MLSVISGTVILPLLVFPGLTFPGKDVHIRRRRRRVWGQSLLAGKHLTDRHLADTAMIEGSIREY